jgi:hypothetical protein
MKTTLCLSLALFAVTGVHAQIFRPEAMNGAVLARNARSVEHRGSGQGGRDGGFRHQDRPPAHAGTGDHRGYQRFRYDQRDRHQGHAWHRPSYGFSPYRSAGIGPYRGAYGYGYVPYFGTYDGYGYGYPYYDGYGAGYPYYGSPGVYGTGSGAANGLLLGALAGGIIGHNSGEFRHNGWRGAAWGAGAGWLLGTVLDAHRRAPVNQGAPVVYQSAPVLSPAVQAVAPAQPQPVTIINNYYNTSTPMGGANGLFGR